MKAKDISNITMMIRSASNTLRGIRDTSSIMNNIQVRTREYTSKKTPPVNKGNTHTNRILRMIKGTSSTKTKYQLTSSMRMEVRMEGTRIQGTSKNNTRNKSNLEFHKVENKARISSSKILETRDSFWTAWIEKCPRWFQNCRLRSRTILQLQEGEQN